jgi:hypothetical protein
MKSFSKQLRQGLAMETKHQVKDVAVAEELTKMYEMESCFLFNMGTKNLDAIRYESFELACGEVLEPNDCIKEIHSSGSAGNLPITTSEGWVMRYIGRLKLTNDSFTNLRTSNWVGKDVILFDAFHEHEPENKYVAPGRRNADQSSKDSSDGYYMAYLVFSGNMLFHTRGGGTSCVVKCSGLTRWQPSKTKVPSRANGAYVTHSIRTDKTAAKILDAIHTLGKQGERISISAVARRIGISREHVNRRYKHLFETKS